MLRRVLQERATDRAFRGKRTMSSRLLAGLGALLILAVVPCAHAQSPAQRDRLERQSDALQREFDRQRADDDRRADELRRRADAEDQRLQSLRARLEQCASCAQRDELRAEIEQIEHKRVLGAALACASLNGAGAELVPGLAALCSDPNVRRQTDILQAAQRERRELEAKARTGGPADVARLATWHDEVAQDRAGACRLWSIASDREHAPASAAYATRCLEPSGRHGQDQAMNLLHRCSEAGGRECRVELRRMVASRGFSADDDGIRDWWARRDAASRAQCDKARQMQVPAARREPRNERERAAAARQAEAWERRIAAMCR